MKKVIVVAKKIGDKVESVFTWLNADDKNENEKYYKIAVAGAMLLVPILLGSLIDFRS